MLDARTFPINQRETIQIKIWAIMQLQRHLIPYSDTAGPSSMTAVSYRAQGNGAA